MIIVHAFEITQPIGTFYVGKMSAKDILQISVVSRRKDDQGQQRQIKIEREKAIALYCSDPDATFPTPIILAVDKDKVKTLDGDIPGTITVKFTENLKVAEILDGQHRMGGISLAATFDYDLPIIIMFNLTESEKAYVFSTVNGNQAPVSKSLIYDLFGLDSNRSPIKTCHQIARSMNADEQSPFYRRLKMLEKRESSQETISQGIFVNYLCPLISNQPQEDAIAIKLGKKIQPNTKFPFRDYWISEKDDVILKILYNYFGAAKEVFPVEWETPNNYILTKSTGYAGLVKALDLLVPLGEQRGDLSKEYFKSIFDELKHKLRTERKELTSKDFSSSGQGASDLAELIRQTAWRVWNK